jgi:heme exporter protein D
MSDFFAMGGYAWYVWGSYGVTFFLLFLEILFLVKRSRNEAKA